MPEVVLFDLDGTLANTAPDLALALDAVRAPGSPPLDRERVRRATAVGTTALLREGLGIEPNAPDYEAVRAAFLGHYQRLIGTATELIPGMAEVLAALNEQGLPWGIVTNKPAHLASRVLSALGLTGHARCLVGGDTLARCKPDPDPLLHACALLRVAPDRCLYVGDDEGDIVAAHRAGMPALAVAFGYATPGEAERWGAEGLLMAPADLLAWVR
ncbi:phosphoglycolate phosphatase [Acidiferrobacter sp.]|uniref:phosphoglycolate phosphatase n=1 Tax=Acidiferrobacter sp. TaxID=1872107 RepID=UPI0026077234|nr:phosphoglycolate phosphatase [Acidiferrobacter sp.]